MTVAIPPARLLLQEALAARQRGDRPAALALLRRARDAAPAGELRAGAGVELATELLALGHAREAEEAYGAVLAEAPRQVRALLGLARCLRDRGETAAALARLQAAAAADPANPWPPLERGRLLAGLGRAAEARAALDHALALQPELPPALLALGRLAGAAGDHPAARAFFARAAAADPHAPGPRLELAETCRLLGDHEAARAAIGAALAARPGLLAALLALGETERAAGDRDAALAAFRQAMSTDPGRPAPRVEAARELLALARPEEARRLLAEALAIDPASRAARLVLAEAALLAGRPAEALATFRAVEAAIPAQAEAVRGITRALVELGRRDEALAALDAAEAIRGPQPWILARRLALAPVFGAPALALAAHAVAEHPRDFALWHEAALLLLRTGALEAAEASLHRAPAATPVQRAVRAEIEGRLAEARWRIDEAGRCFAAALALHPALAAAQDGMVRVALLRFDLPLAERHLRASGALRRPAAAAKRRALRIWQTLPGQLLEEFRLDAETAAQLQAWSALPAPERVAPIAALVRSRPDSTAAAIGLLVTLREAGWLDRAADAAAAPSPGAPAALPPRLGQYWHSPTPPPDIAALLRGWREANPDLEVERFDDAAAARFLAAGPAGAAQAFARAREPAARADLLRLAWLHRRGGLWMDADNRCLGPAAPWIGGGAGFLGYQEPLGSLAKDVLGAAPGDPVIGRALAGAVAAVGRGDDESIWLSTGPGLLTRAFAAVAAEQPAPDAWLRGRRILAASEVLGGVGIGSHAAYKTVGRHWLRPASDAPRPLALSHLDET